MNAEWHRAHPMPKNPTLDQRIAWHGEHARACGCREITGSLREAMLARGIDLPPLKARPARRPAARRAGSESPEG
jgi:hypothetical protein